MRYVARKFLVARSSNRARNSAPDIPRRTAALFICFREGFSDLAFGTETASPVSFIVVRCPGCTRRDTNDEDTPGRGLPGPRLSAIAIVGIYDDDKAGVLFREC